MFSPNLGNYINSKRKISRVGLNHIISVMVKKKEKRKKRGGLAGGELCVMTDIRNMLTAHVAPVYPEPNLLSGTAHSVNKRGVKKRDLDVEELKEILSPLLPFVRTEHILPANSDVLADAVGTFPSMLCAV